MTPPHGILSSTHTHIHSGLHTLETAPVNTQPGWGRGGVHLWYTNIHERHFSQKYCIFKRKPMHCVVFVDEAIEGSE